MRNRYLRIASVVLMLLLVLALGSCSAPKEEQEQTDEVASTEEMTDVDDVTWEGMEPVTADQLQDGTYEITVDSSSSMFNIVKCELTVSKGEMSALMTMSGTGYRYIMMASAEDAAAADDSEFIYPEEDSEGAHTYTVPVEALDKGLPCAAFSDKKEKWYGRTLVFRADSLPLEAFQEGVLKLPGDLGLADGEYKVDVTLSGGTGKASVDSPATLKVSGDSCTALITWSSPHYDYMIVDGEKYLPVNTDGNSQFEIPVILFDRPMAVVADTTAMSEPHEIDYTLIFDSASVK